MNTSNRMFREFRAVMDAFDNAYKKAKVQNLSSIRNLNKKYQIEDKVVIITGASSGIGKATAILFAREGAKVVLAARSKEDLTNVQDQIKMEGFDSLVVPTDVRVKEECQNLIEQTLLHYKKIDILMNNAGISMRANFLDVDLDAFDQLMKTNFYGTLYCTKFALPHLLESKGTLIGISSIAGLAPLPARTAYCASKHALDGFMNTLRIENMYNDLNILLVHPGFTASNIRKQALTEDGKAQSKSPRDEAKMMTSEDVAKSILTSVKIGQRETILTRQGKLAVWMHRTFPSFTDKMILKEMAKEPDSPFKIH